MVVIVVVMMIMVVAAVVVLVGVPEDSSLCLRAFAGSLPSGRKRRKLHLGGKVKREGKTGRRELPADPRRRGKHRLRHL